MDYCAFLEYWNKRTLNDGFGLGTIWIVSMAESCNTIGMPMDYPYPGLFFPGLPIVGPVLLDGPHQSQPG